MPATVNRIRRPGQGITGNLALVTPQHSPVAEILGAQGRAVSLRIAAQSRDRFHPVEVAQSAIDPMAAPPDTRLLLALGKELCLKRRILPWRRVGGAVVILAASRDDYRRAVDGLTVLFGRVYLVLISMSELDAALARYCADTLQQQAEARTPLVDSCRNWQSSKARNYGLACLLLLSSLTVLWPEITLASLCGLGLFALLASTLLKLTATYLHLTNSANRAAAPPLDTNDLPVITVLVPLFKERNIASDLIRRLSRIDYPKERLDICLVVEEADRLTRQTVAQTALPEFIRAICVPGGTLQTKPRALNYALCFARGSIIGVYDAEDAPARDQLRKVACRFAQASPRLACLQGQLDFYNSQTNWLARCFALEYAAWFRIILPGLQRLGLAVPLGGTTLFFRRDILEDIGGWDAHNVTEDADLGIRLARRGYHTEMIDTVTEEEANARALPWVKQRSRWLKGYAVTYAVHMRHPVQLWQELGPRAFFGVQLLFMGTLSQFVLAPLLYSFWLVAFGVAHPLSELLTTPVARTLTGIFLLTELTNMIVFGVAASAAKKRDLIKWIPTLHLYFPLASIAAYKGLVELASRPFYWDKTAHGVFEPTRPPHGPVPFTTGRARPRSPIAAE